MSEAQSTKTWILTGSLENFRINAERGFDLIGFKERRRGQAEQMAVGDEIVFYVTGVQEFGAIARVLSRCFEGRSEVWPPGPKDEAYPWRVRAEPLVVLEEEEFIPARELVAELQHAAKWPAEHWQLAFQGQLRIVSEHDADLLRERLCEASRTGAAR